MSTGSHSSGSFGAHGAPPSLPLHEETDELDEKRCNFPEMDSPHHTNNSVQGRTAHLLKTKLPTHQEQDGALDTMPEAQLTSTIFLIEIDSPDSESDDNDNCTGGMLLPRMGNNIDEETRHLRETGPPIRQGQDETFDSIIESQLALARLNSAVNEPEPRSDGGHSTDEEDFLQIPMPILSTGLVTFAYQRALRNRIRYDKLAKTGEYDRRTYPPTFIHDCLMLPGSLANVLGKVNDTAPVHSVNESGGC